MVSVFSIPAFFLVLREVLEACLVVGIVLAYLNKIGAVQYRKWVWFGAIGGIVVAVLAGLSFGIYFWVKDEQAFSDNAEKIFEGVTFLLAALLLTWMIIWMMLMGNRLRSKVEKKIDGIVEAEGPTAQRKKWSLCLMVFVQVLREGIETFIFLIGTAEADEVGGWRSIPLPGILALIVGVVASYLVFKGMVQLDIIKFFRISGLLMIAFSAGLMSHAFHELQEVDAFGPWEPTEQRDWYNAALWSTEFCCGDTGNEFFAMLRALFGYQDKPTFIEWSTYFGYWYIISACFIAMQWSHIRAARTSTARKTQTFALLSLLFTFVGWVFTLVERSWVGILTMSLGLFGSIVAVYLVFDFTSALIPGLVKMRRKLILASGIGFSLLTVFMFVLHLVEMQCLGNGNCGMEVFFFFGIIYDQDFLREGRDLEVRPGWPPLAALSMSIVITAFFFSGFSLLQILFAINVDPDGGYIHDGAIDLKDSTDNLDNLDTSDSLDPPLSGTVPGTVLDHGGIPEQHLRQAQMEAV